MKVTTETRLRREGLADAAVILTLRKVRAELTLDDWARSLGVTREELQKAVRRHLRQSTAKRHENTARQLEPFMMELTDWCHCESVPQRTGRPRTSEHAVLFAIILMAHTGLSPRRVVPLLVHARQLDLIAAVPSYNTLIRYLQKDSVSDALEMIATESDAAVLFDANWSPKDPRDWNTLLASGISDAVSSRVRESVGA